MTLQEIHTYITDLSSPPISKRFEIRAIVDKYPYFQAVVFIYLKMLYVAEDTTFKTELHRLSASISDRKALFYYVFSKEYEKFFKSKGKKTELEKSRTDILLNAFFETMDDKSIDRQIDYSLSNNQELLLANTDYFALTEKENKADSGTDEVIPMKHQDIIDDFINNTKEDKAIRFVPDRSPDVEMPLEIEKNEDEISEELQDDLFFTETLASIYIKQQKYERAYEIIKRLNLNYPEKNIYFANQISFLEKLIINKKHKI